MKKPITHSLLVNIKKILPAEIQNKDKPFCINFSFENTLFGKIIIASTTLGICYLYFIEDENKGLTQLKKHFPHAVLKKQKDNFQTTALLFFSTDWQQINKPLILHLKATDFQFKVWQALLKIPVKTLVNYGAIAMQVSQNKKFARAVGTAVANNPVAFIIPCHRVIKTSGEVGEYMWGSERKTYIINWESDNYL